MSFNKAKPEPKPLEGRPAIVTGAAQHIGLGVATALAEAGAPVLLTDTDEDGAARQAARFNFRGLEAASLQVDVRNEEQIVAAMHTATELFGCLGIVVANAGVYESRGPEGATVEQFRETMETNVIGAYATVLHGARTILKSPPEDGQAGSIIVISSINAEGPLGTGLFDYDVSKAGLLVMTKGAALEYPQVRINAILPGGVITPGIIEGTVRRGDSTETTGVAAMMGKFVEQTPLGRMGTVADIGRAAVFLADPEQSSFITGSSLTVDGGRSVYARFPGE